ncbi:hypothetical protein D0T50_01855 [Bacteroides sp. 214]|uniref:winged helix-turn-helix domain-containing protein n=1 Tax=Bacteroides sp. 214 TaxID=2302935 RepID=UPI0013CFB1F2|nr:winged helix-turn-helix domain-containing protein [Bacteroides sp. 214]NDW11631.1 hypothetical protein [Bacteroides sp. 214]
MKPLYLIYFTVACIVCSLYYYIYACFSISKDAEQMLPALFEQSQRTYVEKEMLRTHLCDFSKFDPKNLGKRKKAKAVYADTTFFYMTTIVDKNTSNNRAVQTYLIDTEALSVDDLNLIFDSICHSHELYVKSSVGVTASFYTKANLLSRDTTNMRINQRASVEKQGDYEDINYTAYIQLTPYTYWRAMPKGVLYTTIGVLLMVFIIYRIQEYKKHQKNEDDTILPSNQTYWLGDCVIDFEKRTITTAEHEIVKLSARSNRLLELFLLAPDYCVMKEDIITELWSKSAPESAAKNMTTNINRLRNMLKAKTAYTIRVSNNKENFYILELQQEESTSVEILESADPDSHPLPA